MLESASRIRNVLVVVECVCVCCSEVCSDPAQEGDQCCVQSEP